MKVILTEEVDNLGKPGELVTVADGYGRNFLLPRSLAVVATDRNVKQLEHQKKVVADRQAKVVGEFQKVKRAIDHVSITITAQAGEEGKLFGSVTAMDLAEALAREGIAVDRKRILLEEPIKQIGETEVSVKLHPEVVAKFKVSVVATES
ncbi:MAG: 50S ribosomal protein L9 [Deltaproteobacteria bacterium RBG_13_65_10]|nr:MAG: 50S ribosomal protein L9 [Deltaproteobacteria bacterium RBG_13_65_10]